MDVGLAHNLLCSTTPVAHWLVFGIHKGKGGEHLDYIHNGVWQNNSFDCAILKNGCCFVCVVTDMFTVLCSLSQKVT